jgi:hypothetical protein
MMKTMYRWTLALFIACSLQGQDTSGQLSGTISSQDHAPLAGAEVTITQRATGLRRQTMTNASGIYAVTSLPPGEYSVHAELANFRPGEQNNIVLAVAGRLTVDLTLSVGEMRSEITVIESNEPLRTASAEVGEVIPNARLIQLPLNGRRFTDLSLLSDNVVAEPRGTRGAALGQTGATVAIAGQRGGHNMYYLDGVSVTDQYFNNLSVSPSVDAIQEFNIQKSIYAAEYGGKASATISAITKSGTNALHGSAYEFLRNSKLDARNFFNAGPNPPLRQNQFGATVGGAIEKDKTFYFGGFEILRERRSLTRTFSLPGNAVRSGDFSGRAAIYDPLSTNAQGARQAFAGNRIPVTRLDPVAQTFLQHVPIPNFAGDSSNFVATPLSTGNNAQFNAKIDHRFGDKDTLMGRFTAADYSTFRPFGSSDLNETLVPGFGTYITTYTRSLALSHTHIFSPSWVHDLRFGWLRVTGGQSLENQGDNFAQRAGLQGVTSDPAKLGYPAITLSDAYSSMGDPSTVVSRRNTSFDLFSNTSWIHGRHTVKFGGYFFHLMFNPTDSPNARGAFSFTPRYTSSAAGLGNGNAFADFLLGYPSTAQSGIGAGQEHGRSNWTHLFIQDDWKATSRLTFNVGLRYELNGHITDTDNRLSNLQLTRFVVASDSQGNINPAAAALLGQIPIPVVTSAEAGYNPSLLRPSYRRWAPRFGFAWSPESLKNTVIRGGFGIFFNQWAYSVQTVLMQNLPFYFNKNVVTAADTLVPTLNTATILQAPVSGAVGGAGMDQNFRTEYSESWSLGIQHLFANKWVAEVNYFGSKVIGADDATWMNIPQPGPGSIATRRPNPLLSGYRVIHWGGYSNYHSLSLKLERRLTAHTAVTANYTWSKATDVASSPGPTFSETNYPQDVYNRRNERGLSSFDHRHRLAVNFLYELPTLANQAGWLKAIAGGWSLAGNGILQSGAPFTVNLPNDNANIGSGPSQRPDILRDANLSTRTAEHWFDTSAFTMPAPYTFGNSARNVVRGDGLINFDTSLLKRHRIHENTQLEFRAEAFNVLNNTNFADAPGRIAFTPNFGRYLSAENPRQLQLALKFTF